MCQWCPLRTIAARHGTTITPCTNGAMRSNGCSAGSMDFGASFRALTNQITSVRFGIWLTLCAATVNHAPVFDQPTGHGTGCIRSYNAHSGERMHRQVISRLSMPLDAGWAMLKTGTVLLEPTVIS